MNLNKLDPCLCLAFQESEGPFRIIITSKTDGVERKFSTIMSKRDIQYLSDAEPIISIEITDFKPERRWRSRYSSDRRSKPRM